MSAKLTKFRHAFLYLLIFALIYFSKDTLLFDTNSNNRFAKFGHIVLLLIVLVLFVLTVINYKNLNKRVLITTSLLVGVLIINTLVLRDFEGGIIIKLCLICAAAAIVNLFDLKTVFRCYSKILLVLSIVSLIPFIIHYINSNFFSFLPTVKNVSNISFHCGGLFNLVLIDRQQIRNYGIFREPNIFGFFIVLALIYEVVMKEKPSIRVCFVFIITIISTLSTMGFISLAILFIVFLLNGKKKFGAKMFYFLIPIVIACAMLFSAIIIKFFVNGQKIISLQTRLSSILANLKVFKDNILFGTGIKNYTEAFVLALQGLNSDGGNTPTLLINFAMHGFVFGVLCLSSIIGFSFKVSKSVLVNILVIILLVINLLMSSIIYNFMFYFVVMAGLEHLAMTIENSIKKKV